MSDAPSPDSTATDTEQTLDEWKPEPRQWTWKDLFTAPMLAFKPKCMLISLATVVLVALFCWLWFGNVTGLEVGDRSEAHLAKIELASLEAQIDAQREAAIEAEQGFEPSDEQEAQLAELRAKSVYYRVGEIPVIGPLLWTFGAVVSLVLMSLGASLVAVFMKADLLDDEFLSLGEALGQYKARIASAVMVPVFLVAVLFGFVAMIYVAQLVGSIPYLGSILYAFLYPLGYLLGLLTVLIAIAVALSLFVFPSIVAIRKHGWFDNVIDTFEAVGTKPHVVVLNLGLVVLMTLVAVVIAFRGMTVLTNVAASSSIPGTEVLAADIRGDQIVSWVQQTLHLRSPVVGPALQLVQNPSAPTPAVEGIIADNGFYRYFTGLLTGIWKVAIWAFITGYAINMLIGGGMLTYLAVREDDYWDDEDLEDLDKLAKELEEEAKREEEAAAAEAEAKGDATEPAQGQDQANNEANNQANNDEPKADEAAKAEDEATTEGDEKKSD